MDSVIQMISCAILNAISNILGAMLIQLFITIKTKDPSSPTKH